MKEIEPKRFEVKMQKGVGGNLERAVFIGGEHLDYSVDLTSYVEACNMGPQFKLAVQKDIERHFTQSVSEFIGRKVTIDDIKRAIATGWI
jgi:hypothetical protein